MSKEKAKFEVQEAVEKQEKQLSKKELNKLAKKAAKKEEDEKKFMNSMITRAEALQLINRFSSEAAKSLGEMLREPIRTNLIASMALSDILKEKGIMTEEEHIAAMNRIAEDMNSSLESLSEGEENGLNGEETQEESGSIEGIFEEANKAAEAELTEEERKQDEDFFRTVRSDSKEA